MIPHGGAAPTRSKAEPVVYQLLKEQLGDEFTVIHSLPWLSAAARELTGKGAATGEIDFLILHPRLGVLAIEVKGGHHWVQGLAFVHIHSGKTTRAVEQMRAGVHGLAKWLGVDPSLRVRIGYALVFPHSNFDGQIISTALTDVTVYPPQTIVVDQSDILSIGTRVKEIMEYWMGALSNRPIGPVRMKALLAAICPNFDGTPRWASRIVWDKHLWLRLTEEQSLVVDNAIVGKRFVVSGWPGTGKTLILIECARRLLQQGKSVLVLTFNSLLANHLSIEIHGIGYSVAHTWHGFCRWTLPYRGRDVYKTKEWLEKGCLDDVAKAAVSHELPSFDAILIDEAQAFRDEWVAWLSTWHGDRQMIAFCDETQVFKFESDRIPIAKLCQHVGVARPFALTIPLRSPQAVLKRLKAVIKPEIQLFSPREEEADTFNELLVADMGTELRSILSKLHSTGVGNSEVVVLSKFNELAPSLDDVMRPRYATVSSFRGLESPVVVIWAADQMDDVELFCAYSRATTLCIALYDSEVLGVKTPNQKFHTSLLEVPSNAAIAEQARASAQTRSIVDRESSPEWLNISSTKIGWSRRWGAWLVEKTNVLSGFWIDYFCSQHGWPVLYWEEHSIRKVQLAKPFPNLTEECAYGEQHELLPCESCEIVTPKARAATLEWQCAICNGPLAKRDRPDRDVLESIEKIEQLLNAACSKSLSQDSRKGLPLSLGAGAAIIYAQNNASREAEEFDKSNMARVTYRAAMAFAISYVRLQADERPLIVAAIARKLSEGYLMPKGLTLEHWQRDLAMAFGRLKGKGHLDKLPTGGYVVVKRVDCESDS